MSEVEGAANPEGEAANPAVPEEGENPEQDTFLQEIQANVMEALLLFDNENNKTIDKREVGTVIRSLGMFPTEGELLDVIREVEEAESDDLVKIEMILPVITRLIVEKRFLPIPEEKLHAAFQTLDPGKTEKVTWEELSTLLRNHGEPLNGDELVEMADSAVDKDTLQVRYKEYIPTLILEDNEK